MGFVRVVLNRGAGDPRMPARRPPHSDFGKAGFVAVAFEGRPEPVIVPLACDRGTGGHDRALSHRLPQGAEVISAGVEGLPVG